MSLVMIEKLDEKLEGVIRSRGPVTINLADFKIGRVESDPPETTSLQSHPSSSPKKIIVKEEPRDDSGEETETGELVEWHDEVVEETIAPVQIKQERSPSPEGDQQLNPSNVDTAVERKPMAKRRPEDFPSSVKKRTKCDAVVSENPELDPECRELDGVASVYEESKFA